MSNREPTARPAVGDAVGPALEPLVCEFCGMEITDDRQDCAALHDGRCQP